MDEKAGLIEKIVESEFKMFLGVASQGPASCRENPKAFRLHRTAQFSAWSVETLESYLGDLTQAERQGRNLMTLKYARMEGLVPPLTESPVVDQILRLLTESQQEMISRFPRLMRTGRPLGGDGPGSTSFRTYARGELETYSDRTLELLYRDIRLVGALGENWSVRTYTHLAKSFGYASLEAVEEALS